MRSGPRWLGGEPSDPEGAVGYEPRATKVPPADLLPPNERRRAVQTVRLALAVGAEAFAASGRDPAATATIFASSGGDGDTIHEILKMTAAAHPELSPTRFHNSVHNAPAGYWGIATGSRAPSTSLCCYDDSFAAGLLEAAVTATSESRAVAVIAYDVRYPEPLGAARPIGAAFAVALLLNPQPTRTAIASIDIALRSRSVPPTPARIAALEGIRAGTPAARCLPLLEALARENRGRGGAALSGGDGAGADGAPDGGGTGAGPHERGDDRAMTMLDRNQIAALIPHAGTMCLLDRVEHWDANSIRCATSRHRRGDNPLARAEGGIGAVCAVELAAQAMALHGRLLGDASGPPKPGALASVRDLRLHTPRLDGIAGDIAIDALLLMSDGSSATYSFALSAAQSEIARGRATVIFDIGAL